MKDTDSLMRFLAALALVHETADEGWKSAVARGSARQTGEMTGVPDAFVDGLTAMIAEEKERLKAELTSGALGAGREAASTDVVAGHLEELRFEVAELRGRIEGLQASVDALSHGDD